MKPEDLILGVIAFNPVYRKDAIERRIWDCTGFENSMKSLPFKSFGIAYNPLHGHGPALSGGMNKLQFNGYIGWVASVGYLWLPREDPQDTFRKYADLEHITSEECAALEAAAKALTATAKVR